MITKTKLKDLIPRGKRKEVALLAGVSTPAVSKYLTGKTKDSPKIYKAVLVFAKRHQEEITELESCLTLNQ